MPRTVVEVVASGFKLTTIPGYLKKLSTAADVPLTLVRERNFHIKGLKAEKKIPSTMSLALGIQQFEAVTWVARALFSFLLPPFPSFLSFLLVLFSLGTISGTLTGILKGIYSD